MFDNVHPLLNEYDPNLVHKFKKLAKTERLNGRGFLVIKNSDDEVLKIVANKVVFRGKVYVLEMLFNKDIDPMIDGAYLNDRGRAICGFQIGSGGVVSGETTPVEVGELDVALANRHPFRTIDHNVGQQDLTELERNQYFDKLSAGGVDKYFGKAASSTEWAVDKSTNTVSTVTTAEVTKLDARETTLNEVGIYLARKDSSGAYVTFTNLELFSRLTFKSIPIEDETVFKLQYHLFVI